MSVFGDQVTTRWEASGINFTVGAIAGVAIGILVSRLLPRQSPIGGDLRDRARSAVRRLRPGRLQRLGFEQEQLDSLEDTVLESFLADEVLSERGIDIGAISVGVIELSGAVAAKDEVHRAVALANRVPGVNTVVNRLRVETREQRGQRRPLAEEDRGATFARLEGRVGGMGRRRQSLSTDPDRPDDSQKMREEALAAADRDQLRDEGLTGGVNRSGARTEGQAAQRTGFREEELDNQDPHGKNADRTLDAPSQALRGESRVIGDVSPEPVREPRDADVPLDEPPIRDDGR